MYIRNTPFNYNSLKQLNINNSNNIKSKIYNKYKNSRRKIPIKTTFHNYNYNSISKNNNNYNINDNNINIRNTFYSNDNTNKKLKTFNFSISNSKNSIIRNGRIKSLEQLSIGKNNPRMNIMINNRVIKNIFVNKNPKYEILNNINSYNYNKKNPNLMNNYYNYISKTKENIYNDYNLTYENINNSNNIYNPNNINYSNINSACKNIKTFANKNFSGKKLLKSGNKKKGIPVSKNYSNIKGLKSQRGNSFSLNNNIYKFSYNRNNNNIMNHNKKNINNNIRDQIFSFPTEVDCDNDNNKQTKISYTKIKSNNDKKIIKHKSFNEQILLNNNRLYLNTEINNVHNNLISSSSSSEISNELSLLAEDIINIYKTEKRKNKRKKRIKKIKKEINESTENFELIDEIINKADLEEKNKKNRKIKFDLEKNVLIKYYQKEKIVENEKKMEFYFTLLKSKIKFNPVIKNFDKNDIKINKEYILNENLEEYEILGDLYNIFYLKDINDLDKKLKNNIDNLMKKD